MRLVLVKKIGIISLSSGCSSVVEYNLAKVGVEGSNPFARSSLGNDSWIHVSLSKNLSEQ